MRHYALVVEGADVLLVALATTWKRGAGIDIEVLLEVTLAITANSAFGTEIVVSVVTGTFDFEVRAVGVGLLLEIDVVSELFATLAWDADASVVGLKLAGESDVEDGIVDMVLEAAEVAVAELVGRLDPAVGVVDTALDSVEEIRPLVPAAEVPSEVTSVLTLDVDLLDGVSDLARPLISDVPETELEVIDPASDFVCVPATSDMLMDLPLEALEVLETGSPLDGFTVKLFMVPENGDL